MEVGGSFHGSRITSMEVSRSFCGRRWKFHRNTPRNHILWKLALPRVRFGCFLFYYLVALTSIDRPSKKAYHRSFFLFYYCCDRCPCYNRCPVLPEMELSVSARHPYTTRILLQARRLPFVAAAAAECASYLFRVIWKISISTAVDVNIISNHLQVAEWAQLTLSWSNHRSVTNSVVCGDRDWSTSRFLEPTIPKLCLPEKCGD